MATLYVLDWHKRNSKPALPYSLVPVTEVPPPKTTTNAGPLRMTDKNPTTFDNWKPPDGHQVPLVAPCTQKHCQMFCCGNTVKYNRTGNRKDEMKGSVSVVNLPVHHDLFHKDQAAARGTRYGWSLL